MNRTSNPVLQRTRAAIAGGQPLDVKTIRELRARSKQAVTIFKAVFWVGVVLFNVALWVPLPVQFSRSVHVTVAVICLVVAIVVPIFGLRKHQLNLELLKVNKENLKRKTVNEAGRTYMDKVRNLDRPFINAEYELLHGSKWPDGGTD